MGDSDLKNARLAAILCDLQRLYKSCWTHAGPLESADLEDAPQMPETEHKTSIIALPICREIPKSRDVRGL